MDFSPVAIEVANSACDNDVICYTVGDVRTWAPAAPVDLVVIDSLHLPIDDLIAVIAMAGTWLVPDGHLFYLGQACENYTRGVGGPRSHYAARHRTPGAGGQRDAGSLGRA